jgi:flagellar biosynthesis/type III secretory pathway chaperone
MAGMVTQLLEVLSEQTQRYEELLGLSQEKKEAIVKNDIEHLQKVTNLENIVVSQNQKLERKRVELTNDIADVMGKKAADLNLDKLLELLEGQAEHAQLVTIGQKMRDILNELSEINVLNASLIQNALEYIEYSLNVMQTSVNQSPTTFSVKGGQLQEGDGLFDARN